MKAVVLDGYLVNPGDLEWSPLKDIADVTIYDRTTYSRNELSLVIEKAKDAEAIFTNKTPIPQEVMKELPNLKYIGMLSTGTDVVDIKAAKENGIIVTNIPSYSTDTVAQMTIALLLELCHRVGEHNNAVKQGEWANNVDWCFWNYPQIELSGKTMGIIGYGRIGQAVGRIAQALGMTILAYKRSRNNTSNTDSLKYVDLEELYEQSDVISLHCPLTEENKGLINEASIAKMKDGVFILNTARGPLINEQDLAVALNKNKVAGAALDVVSTEPITMDNPLLTAKNSIITPHMAWASKEARQRLLNTAVENLKMYIAGNPINVVNK